MFTRIICIFNNPVSAFVSCVGGILAVFVWKYEWTLSYLFSYLPFILVTRVTWTYHYEVALMFGICCYAFVLGKLSKPMMYCLTCLTIVLAIAAFAYYMPWLYGLQLSLKQIAQRTIWTRTRKLWGFEK